MTTAHAQVSCRRCNCVYSRHEKAGGPCQVVDEDGRCPCLGFWWVEPVAPAPVGYGHRPLWPV